MIDFRADYRAVRGMVADAVGRYAREHAAGAAAYEPVTRIDLEPYLGDVANVTLHLDAGANPWPGEGSQRCFADLELPHWSAEFEARAEGGDTAVTDLDGVARNVSPAKFDQVFHGFFADALRRVRDEGVLDALPKAPGCELGVMCFECGWSWPDEQDRGLENLADPREPPRRLSAEPPAPEARRVAEDATAYDVWAESGGAPAAKAVAALHSVLSLGLPEARAMLASGVPVARDVNAVEVRRVAKGLRGAGVGVRVEPRFRWSLE